MTPRRSDILSALAILSAALTLVTEGQSLLTMRGEGRSTVPDIETVATTRLASPAGSSDAPAATPEIALPPAMGGSTGVPARERALAACAHLCLALNLVTVCGGFVVAAVLRAIAPRDTGYARAQAGRALLWQAEVWGVGGGLAVAVHLVWAGWAPLLALLPLEMLLWLGALLYALCAAIICLCGRPFRYPPWL